MPVHAYFLVFVTVFLAELADKTQLATMSYALRPEMSRMGVFISSSLALVLSTAIAVYFAGFLTSVAGALPLGKIAGGIFVLIGGYMIYRG